MFCGLYSGRWGGGTQQWNILQDSADQLYTSSSTTDACTLAATFKHALPSLFVYQAAHPLWLCRGTDYAEAPRLIVAHVTAGAPPAD